MNRRRINKRKKQSKQKKVKQSGLVKLRRNGNFPPDIHMKPIHRRVIRYYVNSAMTTQGMTPESILASMLAVNSVNLNAVSIFQCIRIWRISMYWVPTGNFDVQGNSLSFRWISQNAPEELFTDRGTLTEPSCIKVTPPFSIAEMWFRFNSPTIAVNFCEMSAPAGSIIDIEFEHITEDQSSGTPTVYTLSSAQPGFYGVVYTSILTGKLIPDGQVTTAITSI